MDNYDKWTQGIKLQTHCEVFSWADASYVVSVADIYPRFLLSYTLTTFVQPGMAIKYFDLKLSTVTVLFFPQETNHDM